MGKDEIRLSATYVLESADDVMETAYGKPLKVGDLLEQVWEEDWPLLLKYIENERQSAKDAMVVYARYIEELDKMEEIVHESMKKEETK